MLLLERWAPAELRPGGQLRYAIRITNISRARVSGVTLTEMFPGGATIESVRPDPARRDGDRAVWQYEPLDPGVSETVEVVGRVEADGELIGCATVTVATQFCAVTQVVQPRLVLEKQLPEHALLCEEIPVRIIVRNEGTGAARNVIITDPLAEGLTVNNRSNGVRMEAGDLAAGQSREFTFRMRAARTGSFRNTARAVEQGGTSAEASASTTVRQPVLAVTKQGPTERYLNRPVTYEITVANRGEIEAANTILTDTPGRGGMFVSAENGGNFADGRVTWNIGNLGPGEQRTVRVTYRATEKGELRNTAAAQAVCAEASAFAVTQIRGIPAVLLEVVDIHDPVELGSEEVYEIVVVNQGSAEGTNIVINCTLPPEQEAVSAAGPSNGRIDGRTIRFDPLPSLDPGARAVYRVTVRGTAKGDVRFHVRMTSDQVETPVEETESTHIY
jgi:uncharacterized repeat protein (TIGR01451 family)